jgi:hypothetical protein
MKTRSGIIAKRMIISCTLLAALSLAFNGTDAAQSNIESGYYLPSQPLTVKYLRHMPIPSANEDYALLQALDDRTTVVLGMFSTGDRRLVLIQDNNADEVVDRMTIWYVDKDRWEHKPRPAKEYPKEKFRELKKSILEGTHNNLGKGVVGIDRILELSKNPQNVRRWRTGYEIHSMDPDQKGKIRLNFFISDNTPRGADMVFVVNYVYMGQVRMVPVVSKWVYCKKSKDPFIMEKVREIVKTIRGYQ